MLNPLGAAQRLIARHTTGKARRRRQNLRANQSQAAIVMALRAGNSARMQPDDFRAIAGRFNVPAAALAVVAEMEGSERAFGTDGRIQLMDDPARFAEVTAHAYDLIDADLSLPVRVAVTRADALPERWRQTWGRHPFDLTHDQRWRLWNRQAMTDFDAAMESISVGRFYVDLRYWRRMGFASPLAMLQTAYTGEAAQLELLLRWLQIHDRIEELRACQWRGLGIFFGHREPDDYARECATLFEARKSLYP